MSPIRKPAEALIILQDLGIPVGTLSDTRKQHVARVFLALGAMTPENSWKNFKDSAQHHLTTKQILAFGRIHWGESRSDGSYDDVRRQDLKWLTLSNIAIPAANKPGATTNDGTRGFGIHEVVAQVVRTFGTKNWKQAVGKFRSEWTLLSMELARERDLLLIPVRLPSGKEISFKPDPHNQLQKAVIEQFLTRFGYGAEVLYVGDAAEKHKHKEESQLKKLGFFDLSHEQLPDIIAYSSSKKWLYLIEVVTSANPVTEERRLLLEKRLKESKIPRIYVSAFKNRDAFRKFAADIAWETEVWLEEVPDHLVHFNGGKFLGPHIVEAITKKKSR